MITCCLVCLPKPRRQQGRFVPIQYLTWRNGDCYPAAPYRPKQTDAEVEAMNVLLALGGYECSICKRKLEKHHGYVCCRRAHCPYCGEDSCRHLIAEDAHDTLTIHMPPERRDKPLTAAEQEAFLAMWKPLPPARPLPAQCVPGYPVWFPWQIQQAYSAWLRPHVAGIFGPDLRSVQTERLREVLTIACLRPDVKTMPNSYATFYYHAYPDAGWNRAERFFAELAEGTERLRAFRPHRIVPTGPELVPGRGRIGQA